MTDIPYKILKQKQKFNIKLYTILCVILAIVIGIYTYMQWNEFVFTRDGIRDGGALTDTLQNNVLEQESSYKKFKPKFDAFHDSMKDQMNTIFPEHDRYTDIAKQMDTLSLSLGSKNNIFEISNLNFQNVIEREDYNILPFRMNIESSNKNFTKFLHIIEESGSLDGNYRLMDVSSIRLNFENSKDMESTENIINFSVQINAYFQK